jgi:2-methylcitrate dehydratase PrpD
MNNAQTTITEQVSQAVAASHWEQIEASVKERLKLIFLDAVGTALAASRYPFAPVALEALSSLGAGESCVIGMPQKLALRDAVVMNGILVHGLDYDDTYLPGSVHLSASCVPTLLGLGTQLKVSGKEIIMAGLWGLEISARVAQAAKGGFVNAGFHATGIAGIFGSTVAASRLMGLSAEAHTLALGVALSLTSGTLQPLQEGSWTKRLHPGWAASSGITAAAFARSGYLGPKQAFEGTFGLFNCFLGVNRSTADLTCVMEGLGERWEFMRTSIKLFPACHQLHAFMNAGIALAQQASFTADNVESVRALISEAAIDLVCEPLQSKLRPQTSYSAQFSLPYAIACVLSRGAFGLKDIEATAYTDEAVLALAQKVQYEIDPHAGFPKTRSGEIIVKMKDGRQWRQREDIFPDEPASAEAIMTKFKQNTQALVGESRSLQIMELILQMEKAQSLTALVECLGA